jgi:hypothetical protein
VDCGIVTTEKSDPIVSFGQQSSHTHVVAGSAAFGPSATSASLRGGGTFLAASKTASTLPTHSTSGVSLMISHLDQTQEFQEQF